MFVKTLTMCYFGAILPVLIAAAYSLVCIVAEIDNNKQWLLSKTKGNIFFISYPEKG